MVALGVVLCGNPTPRIALFVRWSVGPEKIPHHGYMHQGQGSWIYASFISASYTYASGSRIIYICIVDTCIRQTFIGIKDHIYVHHTYMHQGQGSRIIDTCNIHTCIMQTCIRIKDRRHMQLCIMNTCIIDTCIMNTCIKETYMHHG